MKSFIFCTSYFENKESYQLRYQKWIDYYLNMPFSKDKELFVIDDGSDKETYLNFKGTIINEEDLSNRPQLGKVNLIRFKERKGITGDSNNILYSMGGFRLGWYRSFFQSIHIAEAYGYDKIVHIESDAYLITQKACDVIESQNSEWSALWCPKYRFPETSFQIICKDKFETFKKYAFLPLESYNNRQAESTFPFSNIIKSLVGDRYGESTVMQVPDIDYYNQCNLQTNLKFKG